MRRFSYIFILFASLFCACNDNTIDPSGDEQIVVPTKPYIYLDAAVSTRGTLVEGTTLPDNFGVYGFTYAFNNDWDTYKVTAKPNVFATAPQHVTYSNGSYKYNPIKEWDGGKYTFFAFYPSDLNVSDGNVEGTPYLTYSPNFNNVGNHIDVMTAMFEDTSLSSSPYVYFDFYHRLSAVDVVAMNFYEHNYQGDNDTMVSEKIVIELVGLSLAFENVQYKTAKIYMDKRIPSERTLADAGTNPSYPIYTEGSGYALAIDYNTDSTLKPITAFLGKSMIFIPQENNDLTVTTNISYRKRRPNGEYLIDETDNNNVFTVTKTTPFNQPLKEGSRYFLQMTFTSSAVSISIITSDEWDDIEVDYEFE
ncbi:MAG: hypothetical protein J6Q62_03720 [Alistipes sp.]|nr:hypothetical protein [Alistipes sp.]